MAQSILWKEMEEEIISILCISSTVWKFFVHRSVRGKKKEKTRLHFVCELSGRRNLWGEAQEDRERPLLHLDPD